MSRCPEVPFAGKLVATQNFEGFRVYRRLLPSQGSLAKHTHPHSVLTIVANGLFEERMSNRVSECTAGHVRYQPAQEPHTNTFLKRSSCIQIELDKDWVHKLEDATGELRFCGCIRSEPIQRLATTVVREAEHLSGHPDDSFESLILEIFAEAAREWTARLHRRPPWLARVREAIWDELGKGVCLTSLAEAAGTHPVHLCREFHRYYGCTIGEMIRKAKVEHAVRALRGGLPLVDVALECGFSDQSHLCHVFKRYTGLTPSQYRARYYKSSLESLTQS